MKTYDSSFSLVKALDLNDNIVCGFYFIADNGKYIHDFAQESTSPIKINPYTVCRNSGIKDKNGAFVFEYDLLKLKHGLLPDSYGYLVWEESYKSWKIRQFTEFGGHIDVNKYNIEVVGNIILNDKDAEIIYKQDKAERDREVFFDTSDCRPKHKRGGY